MIEQPTDHGQVTPGGGKVQGRGSIAVPQIGVHTLILDLCGRKKETIYNEYVYVKEIC